jgi:hypothetical protein
MLDRGDHRAAHPHGIVEPGPVGGAVVQVQPVVDDVDAAHEGHFAVHHAQLVVQAPQLAGLQPAPPAVQRPEHRHRHTAGGQARFDHRQGGVGAEPVDHHMHVYAALRGGHQRIGHLQGGVVVVEDVGREPDFMQRRPDGLPHGRKQLVPPAQQRDLVAAAELRPADGGPDRGRDPQAHEAPSGGTPSTIRVMPAAPPQRTNPV